MVFQIVKIIWNTVQYKNTVKFEGDNVKINELNTDPYAITFIRHSVNQWRRRSCLSCLKMLELIFVDFSIDVSRIFVSHQFS